MNICVIGAGYVGLTLATVLASLGHKLVVVEKDREKIEQLEGSTIPFYEPKLDELLQSSRQNILFTTNMKKAVKDCPIIFIAVGTPAKKDGSSDLSAIYHVLENIAREIKNFTTIIIKSTVPPSTNQQLYERLLQLGVQAENFRLAFNPEFLKEGTALEDMLHPDKTVIGIKEDDTTTVPLLKKIYEKIPTPYVITNLESAELIKYANNFFLATKISFINELARMSDSYSADINHISYAIGLDPRISKDFLQAGLGYGGSCFPKDLQALQHAVKKASIPSPILDAVQQVNETQLHFYVEKIKQHLPKQSEKITVLGLTFKPETDDLRNSPSIALIEQLAKIGYEVHVYDPKGTVPKYLKTDVVQYPTMEKALENSDCLVLATDWQEFHHLAWQRMKRIMKGNLIVDGRNIWDKKEVERAGLIYLGVGRM